jgi:hypothetical protein
MRKIIFSVYFIFFVHSGLFAQCVNLANIYSFSHNGKNYELVKEKKSWTDAAACAVSRGGYLVQIDDSSEQAALVSAITASGVSTTYNPVSDGGGISYVWIGATDKVTEGIWIWDGNNDGSGTNFWNGEGAAGQNNGIIVSGMYVNWGGKATGTINEPDNFGGLQDAAALALAGWPAGSGALGAAGEWNDINIVNTNYYIIEYGIATGFIKPDVMPTVGLYPNPVRSVLNLSGTSGIQSVKIMNAQGAVVYMDNKARQAGMAISVSELVSGLYMLVVELTTSGSYMQMFFKE